MPIRLKTGSCIPETVLGSGSTWTKQKQRSFRISAPTYPSIVRKTGPCTVGDGNRASIDDEGQYRACRLVDLTVTGGVYCESLCFFRAVMRMNVKSSTGSRDNKENEAHSAATPSECSGRLQALCPLTPINQPQTTDFH